MSANTIIHKNKEYKTECIWRKSKKHIIKDINNNDFEFPVHNTHIWGNKNNFIDKLKIINEFIDKKKKYEKTSKDCLICKKKNITTKNYYFKNYMWENGLVHYVDFHNIEPTHSFKQFIFHEKLEKNKLDMVLSRKKIENNVYVEITKNQLLILDALMEHGGNDKKYGSDEIKRYSEHAGLLDFHKYELAKIIVAGNTLRIDAGDDEIYMPLMEDMDKYEYIFHTHPPTPKPGGRAEEGILYEFPSIGDILHFIDNHNNGNVIGSLVICSEGLYNIRKKEQGKNDIKINEDGLYKQYNKISRQANKKAIEKYGTKFTNNKFYKEISQDTSFIESINNVLNEFDLHIDYYPRKKDEDNNKWYIDNVFLSFRKNK